MASLFANVPAAPPIEIFALSQAFKEDTFAQKVDLGIGAYRDNNAKPWVLPVVRKVEKDIAADESLNHEYLSQLGMPDLANLATKMLLGEDCAALKDGRAFGVQALSGTGALRICADLLVREVGLKAIYISVPSWPNHRLLFNHSGFSEVKTYRYWDAKNRCLDFQGMIDDLQNAPAKSVILLHACAHNPTGIDPTEEQWKKIAEVIKAKQLFPMFDCAYQGFASGDLEKDSWAVRYFASQGFELVCCQSFAKNFGLYNERIGNLTVILNDKSIIPNVKGQLTLLVRGNYSNPPCHGARIVARILSDPALFQEWKECIQAMSGRIMKMRTALRSKLEELGTPGTWSHITTQIGMFSYTGLTAEQAQCLVKEYHVYLPKDGRISLCGLNENNVEYVAKAIFDVVKKIPDSQ